MSPGITALVADPGDDIGGAVVHMLPLRHRALICSVSRNTHEKMQSHMHALSAKSSAYRRWRQFRSHRNDEKRTLGCILAKLEDSGDFRPTFSVQNMGLRDFNARIHWCKGGIFQDVWSDCFSFNDIAWTPAEQEFILRAWNIHTISFVPCWNATRSTEPPLLLPGASS